MSTQRFFWKQFFGFWIFIAVYLSIFCSVGIASSDVPSVESSEGCTTPISSNAPCPYLDQTGLRAWSRKSFFDNVTIGLVSSGLDFRIPSLNAAVSINPSETGFGRETDGLDNDKNGYIDDSKGWDAIGKYAIPWDGFSSMGTFSASLLVAKETNAKASKPIYERSFEGIASSVKLVPIKVVSDSGVSNPNLVAEGLRYAARRGVNLVLLEAAFESSDRDDICSALEELNKLNILVVAPAGNSARKLDDRSLPASCATQNLLVVGSSDKQGELSRFSSFHPQWVQLVAPGVGLYGMAASGVTLARTGTNGSAVLVAAAAAQTMAHYGFKSAMEVKDFLLAKAKTYPNLLGKVLSGGELFLPAPNLFEGMEPQW